MDRLATDYLKQFVASIGGATKEEVYKILTAIEVSKQLPEYIRTVAMKTKHSNNLRLHK